MEKTNIVFIQKNLVEWFRKNQRVLPWRQTKNPYYIWISEIMLQQTKVDTVIDYYNYFITKFPTVEDLAQAKEEDVLKVWEGLGYYSRPKNMMKAARVVKETYDGQMPKSYKGLISLPGIGPYTAGAVASIAYNIAVPAIDGNVLRVFSRLFNISEDITLNNTKKNFEIIGQDVVPVNSPGDFNQGLMELGALICVPRKPRCTECPLTTQCKAYALNIQTVLPVKTKKKKQKVQPVEVGLVTHEDKILITKRPTTGLLSDLWALPIVETDQNLEAGISIGSELEHIFNLKVIKARPILQDKHVFTHIKWEMTLFQVDIEKRIEVDYPKMKWVTKEALEEYPLPTAVRKLLKNI
ncbi:A/G-specific adenine glycosylase [Serpentinicella sp. ANB-PHB4]|uniref:A/G-specific adenine glycosylase n=1 Tax=Serpentinicella sp. ANB-PHB4 TaxID=3074076 RepID=UPI0028561026|nr:A/G-specific adenine glycosylase [Serpentinicella sp. ANB-PHB4]MDR5658789.1 A/G-specific adenine glycosylase [Serpentinicella sp. ANB-PHB4]